MSDWPRTERSRALRRWTWLAPVVAIVFVGCQDAPLPTEPVVETDLPAMTASVQDAGVGADDWIVVFKDGTHDPPGLAKMLTAEHGGTVRSTYQHVLRGFSGKIPPQAIEGIRRNPNVDFVEQDGVVSMTAVGSWGLDRIDQRSLPLSGTFTPGGTGAGVDVWILDTGIDYSLTDEFGSRLDQTRDWDFVMNDDDGSDCQGHGTHVAGTVGSKTYGVATGVTLISIRVLGCSGSGSYSGIIDGMEYVVANATRPSVINMSLSGGTSASVNLAVKNTVAAGVGEDTVSEELGFRNIHYFAAAATKYGTEAKGGYEYDGNTYDIKFFHVEGYNTCATCHSPHTLEINIEECQACHPDAATADRLPVARRRYDSPPGVNLLQDPETCFVKPGVHFRSNYRIIDHICVRIGYGQ